MKEDNYLINSTTVKVNEPCSARVPNQMQDLMKQTRPTISGSYTIDYEFPKDLCNVGLRENDMLELNYFGQNKRCKRSLDDNTGLSSFLSHQDKFEINGSAQKLPHLNIRTVNFCQQFVDQYRDLSGGNNSKLVTNAVVVQDPCNIPSNSTTYSTNGTQINKIKTANSSGSSFLVQSHGHTFTPLSQISHSVDINQSKFIKSQNIAFSQKLNENNVKKINDDDCGKSTLNSKIISYVSDGSLNFAEYKNPAFGSSNKIVASRKNSLFTAHSEYYESDVCSGSVGLSSDNSCDGNSSVGNADINDSNIATPVNKEDTLTASDFLFTNNYYLPTITVNEPRNPISYIGQAIPVVVLNSNVDCNPRNFNNYPQFCLTHLVPLSHDTVNQSVINTSKEKNDGPESFVMLPRDFMDVSEVYCPSQRNQQFSSNNYLTTSDYSPLIGDVGQPSVDLTIDETITTVDPHNDLSPDTGHVVGKFSVTTVNVNDEINQSTALKSIENTADTTFNSSINFSKYLCNDDLNMNTNSGNQQPRSRFKKTRIRETIERWCTNGLNTYDCRFKVIPSKIMNLRNKNQDTMSQEYQPKIDHDNGYRCHSTEYNNKEFRFWDSGDRIAICGKSDYDTENYCQFHAKFINLLNQKQNLSLSKLVPQCVSMGHGALQTQPLSSLSSSSPQIIRTVLISSPDNDNYTMNIDSSLSQNVALSAPPVSPSIMNSIPVSSMPINIHSPQPAASMVMVRCQTPVILTSATRTATLMHESISIERINRNSTSKMTSESDNATISGHPIILTENNALIEMWSNYPMAPDQLPLKLPSPTRMTNSLFQDGSIGNDDPPSLYSMGPLPHIFYSIPQQSLPSVSPATTSKRSSDHIFQFPSPSGHLISDPLSTNVIHEIDNSFNSLKCLIHRLIQSEQQPLLNDIKVLLQANDNLRQEVREMKRRSDYLESILQENHIPIAVDLLHRDETSVSDQSNQQHSVCHELDDSAFDG